MDISVVMIEFEYLLCYDQTAGDCVVFVESVVVMRNCCCVLTAPVEMSERGELGLGSERVT